MDAGCFINGPQVADFERAFARFCMSRRCVGVGSGLDALRIALIALDADSGDEVIVPANTFVATIEAVEQSGLDPAFVDVSTTTRCVVTAVKTEVSATPACCIVRAGQMADMRRRYATSPESGLPIVEDACQAHGAVARRVARRLRWAGSGVQLLPGQESRRDG